MKIIIDATTLVMYPFVKPGFSGGTEAYVKIVARGLAAKGHTVHIVAPDADRDEQWAPNLYVWPDANHPTQADVVVAVHSLQTVSPDAGYDAPVLVCATNGLGAYFGPDDSWVQYVDLWPVFTQCHADFLAQRHGVDPAKCRVTGLGVDLDNYPLNPEKVPSRIFVANDPARGLWHVLDIFERVVAQHPEATLHLGYDVPRQIELRRWGSFMVAQMMLECERRIETIPNIANLGALTPAQVVAEQLACQVHVWPSDPPNVGSQIHGLSQLENAAAGCALVLSDIEAFPELFGAAAEILPIPGTFVPQAERRVDAQDWADAVVELMRDPVKWAEASRKARALAEQHSWDRVVTNWDRMLTEASA